MGKKFSVIADFTDRETGDEIKVGSIFEAIDDEHEARLRAACVIGKEVTDEPSDEWPKHVGGGNYELSNGDRVKGKDEAAEKQAELDASIKSGEGNADQS